jgi:DNA-binding transcriptional ArsR family regulator
LDAPRERGSLRTLSTGDAVRKPALRTLGLVVVSVAILLGVGALLLSLPQPPAPGGTIRGTVTGGGGTDTGADSGGPLAGVEVELRLPGENASYRTTHTSDEGYYEFTEVPAGTYDLWVEREGFLKYDRTVTVTGSETLTEDLTYGGGATGAGDASGASAAPSAFPVIVLIVASAALLAAVLYAKIHRSQLLQNVVRQRIYEHVQKNPGKHYRAILDDLSLPMGVLTYHLNTLEKAGLIKSRQDGVYRRFYPPGMRADVTFFLSEIQQRIVAVIQENRGISQARIAAELEVSRPLVNYHVHILRDAGLVRVEPRGRATACFLTGGES